MHELFVREFVILLNEDETLRSLVLEAVSKQEIGPGRARNKFRKLLKHFASDLRAEAVNNRHRTRVGAFNNHHQELVRFINTNSSNITQELFSEFPSNDQKAGDKIPEPRMHHYADGESQKKVEDLQISQDPEFVKQTTPAHLNSLTYYNDTSDQIELSESDEGSDQDGVDEEDEPVKLDIDLTEHFDELRQFILDSAAYRTLRRRFDEFIRPSLGSKIEDLLLRWSRHDHRHHSFVARYKLFNLVAELKYIHPQEIRLDEDNKRTHWQAFLGYYQKKAEDWTQEAWDWWPLPPYLRPLENNESRLRYVDMEKSDGQKCPSLLPDV
ncbi:hypothetical protein A0O28_0042880 [Trichoderma guizhouense]|uniref:Uncharacterized protein n=1 Tax=Trichoderma guizhouense TaxID=1491466 RepID=A0A1T3C8E4_9HYPO|nr:hypothetical protein A0O28_0042880 [Trichoderma guizhouense]